MYSEWRYTTLEDIAEINMGQSPKSEFYNYESKGIPFLQGNREFGLFHPKIEKYTTCYKKKAEVEDILMSVRAPVGELNISTCEVAIGRGLCAIKAKKGNSTKYIYYLLKDNIKKLQNRSNGTVFQSINGKELKTLPIKISGYVEQEKISMILSVLDSKIENNNKINDILEELAQTLFKRWFVDFDFPNEEGKPYKSSGGKMIDSTIGTIPKGWDVTSLDDVTSKVATGLNPRKNFVLGEGNNYYVTIKNMSNNNVVLDSKCDKITNDAIDKINKRSDLKKGDLLISGIGTIGRVHLIFEEPKNWNISESVFTLRANEMVSEFFLYVLLLNKNFQEYSISNAMGSVQKGLRMKDLKDYTFALPPKDKMCEIEEVFRSLISQVKENDIENRKLSKLRDTLLPKLMSGEIRVPIDKD